MQKVWKVFQYLANNIMNWDFIPKLSSAFFLLFILIDNDAEDVGFGIDDTAQGAVVFPDGQGRDDESGDAADDGTGSMAYDEIA